MCLDSFWHIACVLCAISQKMAKACALHKSPAVLLSAHSPSEISVFWLYGRKLGASRSPCSGFGFPEALPGAVQNSELSTLQKSSATELAEDFGRRTPTMRSVCGQVFFCHLSRAKNEERRDGGQPPEVVYPSAPRPRSVRTGWRECDGTREARGERRTGCLHRRARTAQSAGRVAPAREPCAVVATQRV